MGRGGLGVKGIFVLFVFEGVFFSWLGRKRGGGGWGVIIWVGEEGKRAFSFGGIPG